MVLISLSISRREIKTISRLNERGGERRRDKEAATSYYLTLSLISLSISRREIKTISRLNERGGERRKENRGSKEILFISGSNLSFYL